MRAITIKLAVFLVAAVGFHSCYPDMDGTIEEYDIAITHYNNNHDFASLNTYYLPDTVVFVGEEDKILPIVDHLHDSHILGEIRRNFSAIGWTEINDTSQVADQADVTLFVSVLKTDVYSYVNYWYDYWYWYPWDWWYYSYDPYYYWYPGYSTGYYDYDYTAGTLLIEMLAVRDLDVDEGEEKTSITVPIVWTAAVNGILGGSATEINSRLTTQIDKAFEQSPYLRK